MNPNPNKVLKRLERRELWIGVTLFMLTTGAVVAMGPGGIGDVVYLILALFIVDRLYNRTPWARQLLKAKQRTERSITRRIRHNWNVRATFHRPPRRSTAELKSAFRKSKPLPLP